MHQAYVHPIGNLEPLRAGWRTAPPIQRKPRRPRQADFVSCDETIERTFGWRHGPRPTPHSRSLKRAVSLGYPSPAGISVIAIGLLGPDPFRAISGQVVAFGGERAGARTQDLQIKSQ